jgi:DNA-binding CsgD family transcriptional regulator
MGELFGREREFGLARALLDGAMGRGSALLVCGGAGLGKSSLLKSVASQACAQQMRVQAIKGIQFEADLPFAGLHRLLQPFLDRLGALPARQADAVRSAFGLAAGRPESFLIALALLNLLEESAYGAPLLVTVDDAQWLDRASSKVLAIMARRLEPTRVVLVAAARPGPESPLLSAGLPMLDLGPLGEGAASALLNAAFPRLNGAERERVLADARGNPLALLELPRALRAGYRGPLPPLPPLTPRLEQAFATGDLGLPAATRALLLIAAASDTGNLDEVIRAGAVLGIEPVTADWLAPAVQARLVQVEGIGIQFCHPLIRSASYAQAPLPERRAAHAAIAGLLEGQPERQAWHHAATMTRPDETVAEELELAAGQAVRRGAIAAAVTATERAAELTAEPQLRGSRLLDAADLALDLGRGDEVQRLKTTARSLPLGDADQVRLAWLDWTADPRLGDNPDDLRMLAELADQASRADAPELALGILSGAAFRCFWAGYDRQPGQRLMDGLMNLPIPADHPWRLASLALVDPAGHGKAVTEAVFRLGRRIRAEASMAYAAGAAVTVVGDVHLGASLLADAVALLRAQGRIRLLAQALTVQAWAGAHLADSDVAAPAAQEGIRLAAETDQPLFVTVGQGALLLVAAMRGDKGAVGSLAVPAQQRLAAGPARYGLAVVHAARGLSALGDARYSEAYEHLRPIFDPADAACHHPQQYWHIQDFAEAAARSDHHDQARTCLAALEPHPGAALLPWPRAGLCYARALLAEDNCAEWLFHEAMDAAKDLPFMRARAQLEYGSWLRRQRRIAESREPLRASAASFDTLRFGPWAARAGQELRASGGAAPVPATPARDVLSPQELRIAELAASGLSNRQIGQRVYLSHRTVAAHLYHAFPKLGISSRYQIREALLALDNPRGDLTRAAGA